VSRRVVFLIFPGIQALDLVRSGTVITSAGVSAGIDMALRLVAELFGGDVARAVQLGIEYAPDPPFRTGSPESAPPGLVAAVTAALSRRGATWLPPASRPGSA
jgi:hypothetical protein